MTSDKLLNFTEDHLLSLYNEGDNSNASLDELQRLNKAMYVKHFVWHVNIKIFFLTYISKDYGHWIIFLTIYLLIHLFISSVNIYIL